MTKGGMHPVFLPFYYLKHAGQNLKTHPVQVAAEAGEDFAIGVDINGAVGIE